MTTTAAAAFSSSASSSMEEDASSVATGSSVVALLTPWLDILDGARIVGEPPSDDEAPVCRVIVAVHVDLDRHLSTIDDAFVVVGRVRQLMELLRVAFLVDAAVLSRLYNEGTILSIKGEPLKDHVQFPSRDLRFVLHYTASTEHCASTHRAIGAHLLTARPVCEGTTFQSALNALQADCVFRFQIERRATPLQVALSVTMEGVDDGHVSAEGTEDVVWKMGLLAARVRAVTPSPTLLSTAYFPTHVTTIGLRIRDIPVTRRIVFAVQDVMRASAGLVRCEECVVDPRRVVDSAEELRDYLKALTQPSPMTIVHVGHVSASLPAPILLDERGEDLSSSIRMILGAVGSCRTVHAVNIAPLARLISSSRNRACFWKSVLELVLCAENAPPLREFHFKAPGGLVEQDAQHLRRATNAVRKPRRVVQALIIDSNREEALVLQLIAWIGRVTSLSVTRKVSPIGSAMVRGICRSSPRIERLTLDGLLVHSMAVFTEALTHPTWSLRSLVLQNFQLLSSSTADLFLGEIGDKTSAAAKHLCALDIRRTTRNSHPLFAMNTRQVRLLADVLKRNTTLRQVTLPVQPDVAIEDRSAVLRHSDRNMMTPSVRERHRRRLLAFLSAISAADPSTPWQQLDSWALGRIFAFSAPHSCRFVALIDE